MGDSFQTQRDLVITAALPHVAFEGWTWKAFDEAAFEVSGKRVLARRLFTEGLGEVAEHFADWVDRHMVAELEKINFDNVPVRQRIHATVKTRIVLNAPYREAIRRLMSFLAFPHNAPLAGRIVWRSCSLMWYSAGDRSTDWNYYSKRLLLASVYSATLLYWLSDEGDTAGDFPGTWAFLERRINDVLKTFGMTRRVLEHFNRIPTRFADRTQ